MALQYRESYYFIFNYGVSLGSNVLCEAREDAVDGESSSSHKEESQPGNQPNTRAVSIDWLVPEPLATCSTSPDVLQKNYLAFICTRHHVEEFTYMTLLHFHISP